MKVSEGFTRAWEQHLWLVPLISIYVFIQSFLDYVTSSHGSWRGFKKVVFWKPLVVKEKQAVVKSRTNLHGQCGVSFNNLEST